ncbi:DnaA ATPase domain-containing protein [Mycoplasmopsis lipophila]|uniref:DnaA ATPase domain-containing protein n=1 Tax=Mycoplasmopsis lipophila TaxID=2117 RepID=UPI003872EA46
MNNQQNEKTYDQKKVVEFIKSEPKILDLIKTMNVTDEEILNNIISFLKIKEFFDNSDNAKIGYEIRREANKKLVFVQKETQSNFTNGLNRFLHLILTDISEPDENCLLKTINLSSSNRKNILKEFKNITKSILQKNNFGNIDGIYLYGKSNSGKSYLMQAFANFFASNKILTSYILNDKLFQYIVKNSKEKKQEKNQKVIELLKKVNFLIIDNLGLENAKYSSFILNEILDIIEERNKNNLLTFFSSPYNIATLKNIYEEKYNTVEEKYRIDKLINLIKNLAKEFNVD